MIRSFGTAVSGLQAAQAGLYVVGHNVANVSTPGYTRQQMIQTDFSYQTIGSNATGNLKVGLGTDIAAIRQIRNEYLDAMYRNEVSKTNHYAMLYTTGSQIESILGELFSDYSTSVTINNLWSALQELTTDPGGVDTRSNFIALCQTFLNKMSTTYDNLVAEQQNLNQEVKQTVKDINNLTQTIHELNKVISIAEASGQSANDYRDIRNSCLDQLSKLINIEYSENAKGEVEVFTSGKELVCNGAVQKLGLRYTSENSNLVEPVFTDSDTILPYDPTFRNGKALFNYVGSHESSGYGGQLYGLIVSRGLYDVNNFDCLDPQFTGIDIEAFSDDISLTYGFFFGIDPSNTGLSTPVGTSILDFLGLTAADLTAPAPPDPDDPAYIPLGAKHPAYITAYDTYLDRMDTYLENVDAVLSRVKFEGKESVIDNYDDQLKALEDFKAALEVSKADFEKFQDNLKHFNENQKFIEFNATECSIPAAMTELDTLFNYIVTLINDSLSTGYDANGDASGTLVFHTKDGSSYYTLGNVILNPALKELKGYNLLCLSETVPDINTPGIGNAGNVVKLLAQWGEKSDALGGHNIEGAYRQIVNNVAKRTNDALNNYESSLIIVQDIDEKRSAISGVSLDEELTNMMKFQHAYNAASRMINVIDSMIDKVINGTGRVGR